MNARPTTYTVYPDGFDAAVNSDRYLWTVTVTDSGVDDLWAVRRGPWCYNSRGEFDHEPQPSSRTDRWLKSHRFPLGKALTIAEKVVADLRIMGRTLAEASAHVAARMDVDQ